MARREGESSNAFFVALGGWNDYLNKENIYFSIAFPNTPKRVVNGQFARAFAMSKVGGSELDAKFGNRFTAKAKKRPARKKTKPPPPFSIRFTDEERVILASTARYRVSCKEDRRHAHAVGSRIDTDEMKAVQLFFTNDRLKRYPTNSLWNMAGEYRAALRAPKNSIRAISLLSNGSRLNVSAKARVPSRPPSKMLRQYRIFMPHLSMSSKNTATGS